MYGAGCCGQNKEQAAEMDKPCHGMFAASHKRATCSGISKSKEVTRAPFRYRWYITRYVNFHNNWNILTGKKKTIFDAEIDDNITHSATEEVPYK